MMCLRLYFACSHTVLFLVADGLLPTGGSVVSRVRLLDEAENQGYTTSILDSDLVEYYQMLAENGDVNAQVSYCPVRIYVS